MARASTDRYLVDFEGLLRSMPRREDFGTASDEYLAWLTHASDLVQSLQHLDRASFEKLVQGAQSQAPYEYWEAYNSIAMFIRNAQQVRRSKSAVPSLALSIGAAADSMTEAGRETDPAAHTSGRARSSVLLDIAPCPQSESTNLRNAATSVRATRKKEHKTSFLSAAGLVLAVTGIIAWMFVGAKREQEAQYGAPSAARAASVAPQTVKDEKKQSRSAVDSVTAKPSTSTVQEPEAPADSPISTSVAGQRIAFARPSITVSGQAAAAVLTLHRYNGRAGRLRVVWRIKGGTARAGQEFTGPMKGSLEFADLQTVRSLYIPLHGLPSKSGARNFTVEITSASNGVRIAPNHAVTVTILNYG